MGDLLLELKNVSKTFRGVSGHDFKAVQNVSFDMKAGENVGIVGESGCGKSTLVKMITGLTPVTDGEIYLEGELISGLRRKAQREVYRHIQMVFQDPYSAISPRMPAGTFLTEGLLHFGMIKRSDAVNQAKHLMELVDLDPGLCDRLPHQLSGGQLQRVVIARAISIHPKLIILDEATSALDVSVQKQILDLLIQLQKEFSLTYLFIGHDLAVVRAVTDHIFVMKDGCFVEELPSRTLSESAENPYTRQLLDSVFSVETER